MQEGPVIICYVVWEKGEFGEDHMVFRGSGRGISLRQQSLRGDLSKLTASEVGSGDTTQSSNPSDDK